MASPQARPAGRRRQRSTRLTVAVAILVLAALAVLGAVLSGSWLLVSLAAALAVVLGAAATRITHSELAATRRDAARDRAEQAQAYREHSAAQAADNAAFVASMQERAVHQAETVSGLEQALTTAQERSAQATRKLNAEARRADSAERAGRERDEQHVAELSEAQERAAEAIVRVAELEQELDAVRAELDVVTAAWRAAEAGARRRA